MPLSGEQTRASLGELSPGVAVPSRRTKKGGTQTQGINLLPLVLKWFRVAGILLAIWLVGYFGFNLTWVLIAELGYVGYAVYRGKKKAIASRAISMEEDEPVLARVDELPAWVYFPDSERSEWLNKIIQQMWPYIGQLVEKILKTSVEPIINAHLPAKLTPFKFEDVNLGTIPLRVGGVKVYADNVNRNEIILDVDVTLASDAELKVSVRGLTAGIKEIMIHGTVRVVMRPLVNRVPIIGGLSLFFISQPILVHSFTLYSKGTFGHAWYLSEDLVDFCFFDDCIDAASKALLVQTMRTKKIDFDLTDVANVLDMPLLSTTLRTIISDQIANYLVLPNKIPIKLIENVLEAQINLLLPQGVVYFTVIEASELKKADIGVLGKGKSDPYCKLTVGEHEFLTDVIKNTLEPHWNKSFEVVMKDCRNEVIKVEVMDKDDPGPDDYLGSAYLDIDDLPDRGIIDTWLTLQDVKTGQVHMRATWLHLSNNPADLEKAKALKKKSEIESTAILVIRIDSAKDLPSSKKYLKEPSPYVRLELGNREAKTAVKHASTNPKWEEDFQFLVNDPEVQDLTVEVLDDGNHGKKLGDRKVSLKSELLTSEEMTVTRPFTLKHAARECSLTMTLILRILTPEKPLPDEDLSKVEDATDAAKKEPSLPAEGERVTDSGGSVKREPPVLFAEPGDSVSSYQPSRSGSTCSGNVEKVESSGLRYRGIQAPSDGKFGRIQLTIRYSVTGNRLAVVIHQCVNLIPCDSDNLADPYVRVYLLPDRSSATKRKTQIRRNILNPTFDETFDWQMMIKSDVLSRTLEVMVKNSVGPFSKQRVNMGVLHIKLSEIDDIGKAMTEWFDLQDPDTVEKS